ncbi:sulfite exporter TauE/SafE family protein [Aromatoleum aromaticum]|uniref:sulfite exporter TauE/SafE family protein n=1 Tax=Aromatoleum aromaticum TaxID=551760 RepID=UPI0014598D99|nr:sulfite exporter TauE/SafE family protein [Aromatoleum aromaticum]NMG56024.1 TSUP family transporter [Aromatoleum aromaticum]
MTMLSAFLVLAALVSGFLNGIGGSGGPVLLTALLFSGLSPVAAISTNKLTALIGSMGAIRNFSKERKVDLARSSPYLLATAFGAVLGASFALSVSERVLGQFFSVLVFLLVIVLSLDGMLRNVRASPQATSSPGVISTISLMSGAYNGLFGPGTLILTILPLRIFAGFAMVDGIALATVLNSVSNLVACLVFGTALYSAFTLDPVILAAIVAANFIGQNMGSRVAIRAGESGLKLIVFGSLLVLLGHLIWKYWISAA